MSQNTLIEKIQNDAAAEVEEIKAEAQKAVEAIQSETEAEVEELNQSSEAALKKQKEQLELVTISKAKQSGKIAVQTAKRAQIDSILDGVRTDLAKLDSDEYVKFFVSHVSTIVPKDTEVTSVSAPKNRADETAKVLKESGLSGEVSEDATIEAGLMIQAADGVYDVTLARLIEEKRASIEAMVVNQVMS